MSEELPVSEATETQTPEVETTEAVETKEGSADEQQQKANDPVKLEKALNRKKSELRQLKAQRSQERNEIEFLRKEIETIRTSQNPKKEPETVEQYLSNLAEEKAAAKIKEHTEAINRNREAETQREKQVRKHQEFTEKAEQLAESLPDFFEVLQENADEPVEQHVLEALGESPLGAYYAIKEGLIESLNAMSPAKAAMEIAKLELKGSSFINAKPVSRTPNPMKATRGNAAGSSSLESMDAKQLMNWLRS